MKYSVFRRIELEEGRLSFLDRISWTTLVLGALLLGLAPFSPEPHLLEKLRMLGDGTLHRPLDIFDLFLHGSLPLLLVLKMLRVGLSRAD